MGAAAVCKHEHQWRTRRSCPGTTCIEGLDTELCAIGLALAVAIDNREILQETGVKTGGGLQRLGDCVPMNGTPGAGPTAATGEADQQKSAESP